MDGGPAISGIVSLSVVAELNEQQTSGNERKSHDMRYIPGEDFFVFTAE